MSNHPAPSPFVGRGAELARLQAAWDQVTAGEPRFLVWTADTGLGKTRLVQAFYEWLSTERDAREPDGYWPDALSISGRTLEVNPEFTPTDGPRPDIPWLWWGLRFTDSRYERGIAASTCGLSNARGHLEPHLEPVIRARYGRELAAELAKSNAGIWINLLTAGLSGLTAGIAGAAMDGLGIFELDRQRRRLDAPLPSVGRQQAEQQRDTVEELLALYRAALGSGMRLAGADGQTRKRPIPCALILDDAQWADVDTLHFLETLYREALRERWPLLVLCTHWQKEWNLHEQQARTPNPEPEPRSIADLCQRIAAPRGGRGAGCCEVIPLPRLPDPDLRPVLAAALPGVTDGQADALLARVGGNPGFLVDLIAYARTTADTFMDDDPTRPLTPEGFQDLVETSELDQRHLIEKRFRELDKDLQQTLALASYQGARFLEELLLETARRLDDDSCSEGQLRRAENPHAVIEQVNSAPSPPASEFRHRSWYEVANDYLGKPQQRARGRAFADQLRAVLTDWRSSGRLTQLDPRDQILALNLLAGELRRALDAGDDPAEASTDASTLPLLGATLADLVQAHRAAGEPRQAATAAGELARRMPQGGWPADQVDLTAQFSAAFAAQEFTAESDALALYSSVITASEAAGYRTGTPEQQKALSGVYSNRGIAHRRRGDFDVAIDDFGDALKLGERLRSTLGVEWPPEMQNILVAVYTNRGRARADRGDLDGAITDYDAAIELGETLRSALAAQWPPAMQNDLATVYSNRGLARADRGDFDAAITDHGAAIGLRETLCAALGAHCPHEIQNGLATVYYSRGIAQAGRGDLNAAIDDYETAIKLGETLRSALGDQWPPGMQNDLAAVYSNRGLTRVDRGDLDAAIADYGAAIELLEKLNSALGAQWPPAMQNDLATVYLNRGAAHQGRGDLDTAIADYDAAIKLGESLRSALGAQWPPAMQNALAAVYSNRGLAHTSQGDLNAAIADFDIAIKLREALRSALGAQWPPQMQNDRQWRT